MYIYQITNLVNNKIYIGQTNNIQKRWNNHKNAKNSKMAISLAIQKYGAENFKFEVLYKNVPIEEIDELEKKIIKEKNSRVPNGYNIAEGGQGAKGVSHPGEKNSNAKITDEEAQYIKDHRNIPLYVLYEDFSEKISYGEFKAIYYNYKFKHLIPHSDIYPFNNEFSNQFTSGNALEYDEVIDLRNRYAKGEYWKDVFQDYKDKYVDEWGFWNVYYGNKYKLVMPEVFTEEMRKYHSSLGKQGALNGRSKLTEKDVLKIRQMHREGIDNSEIYKLYPQVSKTSIRNVINNITWKNLL